MILAALLILSGAVLASKVIVFPLDRINRNQGLVILLAVLAMGIAYWMPPYSEDYHGLLTGTSYYPFREPPTDIPLLTIDETLLFWEFVYIGLTLFTALAALQSGGKQRQKTFLFLGLAIEMGAFLCCLPQMSSLFGPQLTWLMLNFLAVLVSVFVLYAGRNML